MVKWLGGALALLLAAAVAFYVLLHRPQTSALAETAAQAQREAARADQAERAARLCAQETSVLNSRVAESDALLTELRSTSAQLAAQVAERERELQALRSTQDDLVSELHKEIADGRVQVERLKGQVRVELVDAILFDSGEAVVKPQGQEVLRRIAEVLKKTDRTVQVQGHTDNLPIVGRLAQQYATNWELSAARAVNVTRFLHEKARVQAEKLSATAVAEYRPRADNASDEGRRKNRRIEILLGPSGGS